MGSRRILCEGCKVVSFQGGLEFEGLGAPL